MKKTLVGMLVFLLSFFPALGTLSETTISFALGSFNLNLPKSWKMEISEDQSALIGRSVNIVLDGLGAVGFTDSFADSIGEEEVKEVNQGVWMSSYKDAKLIEAADGIYGVSYRETVDQEGSYRLQAIFVHMHDVLEVIPRTFNDEEALQIINKVVSGLSGSEAVATNRSVVLGKFKVNLPTGWSIYRTETDSVEFNGEGRSACGFSLKDIADFGVTDEIASQYDDDTLGKIIINYLAQVIPDSKATVTANGINVLRYWQSLVSGDRVAIAYISKGTNLAIISAYDTDETVSYNMVDSLVQQISLVP